MEIIKNEPGSITIELTQKGTTAILEAIKAGIHQMAVIRDIGGHLAGMPEEAKNRINEIAMDASKVHNLIVEKAKEKWPV